MNREEFLKLIAEEIYKIEESISIAKSDSKRLSKEEVQQIGERFNMVEGLFLQFFHEFLSGVDTRFHQRQEHFGGAYGRLEDRVQQRLTE